MRRKGFKKRQLRGDVKYDRADFSRFINGLIKDGKKSAAENIFYNSLKIIEEKTKKDPLETVDKAFKNVEPKVEVRSRRIGGANYPVPQPVRPERKFALICRWITNAARSKKGRKMENALAEEFMAAANNDGAAVKKKQDVHRIAEANKAFAHFAQR